MSKDIVGANKTVIGFKQGLQRAKTLKAAQKTVTHEAIVIEKFYLLKTAQALIDQAVEKMQKQFFEETNVKSQNANKWGQKTQSSG